MKKVFYILIPVFIAICFGSCDVPNDIPYPIVEGRITTFEVEGQCGESGSGEGSAAIDKDLRTVSLFVCDTVDVKKLKVNRIELKSETKNPDVNYQEEIGLLPDSAACVNFTKFPRKAFANPDSRMDTRMDFSKKVKFTLHTYQDYEWTVKVEQIVNREVEVENQVGNAVIDPATHNVVVYVNKEQSLKRLKVHKFSLGGVHGKVSPDPTTYDTYDFYDVRHFHVATGWGEEQSWRVMVCHTDAAVQATAQAFARTVDAIITGEKPNGTEPVIEYKAEGESAWKTLAQENINSTSTGYSATIPNLNPSTTYSFIVTAGDSKVGEQSFTTTEMLQLENASFDAWCTDANNPKLFYPWAEGTTPYWETGNKGATTVGNSNSVPTDDTSTGCGKAAYLESKYIVIKFAAGNIFTGSYLRTDGTNGILGFGRPFKAFPSKLTFDYKYNSETINKVGDEALRYMEGRPDSCQIYITLWHIGENDYEEYNGEKFPLIIRTRPSERHLFSPNDKRVVAYAQLTQGNDVNEWSSHTLELKYKDNTRIPTHIQVVASSSKYGDYFTGGIGSTLVLDNLKLHYE